MAFSLIASAKGEGSPSGGTTGSIDTTGADLIVISIGKLKATSHTISDSKSNTWTELTESPSNGNNGVTRLYYCVNPTVGSGHTFTISGSFIYGSICAAAFSGVDTSDAFEAQNSASGASSTSGQPGSITPAANGALIVYAGMSGVAGTYVSSVDTGTLLQVTTGTAGNDFPTSISWYEQPTSGAINPTLTTNSSAVWAAAIAAFNAAATGGATDLTIADSTHSHAADNAVLTSSHLLTVADATHAHSADNVALSTAILLALADALHGHTADNLTLTLAGSEDLVIADASHAHTADGLSLTTLSVLVVAEALHSHLADNVVLSLAGTENLVIADGAHAHSADNLSLTSQLALSIAEATHAHTADGIVITSQHVLAVADALHAHLADNLTLSDAPSLTIAEASHVHTADNLALTSDSLLAIADAAHAHLADEIELTSAHTLAIIEAMHAHLADNVTLSLITLRAVELLIAAARDNTLTAAARDTTLEARHEFHG